MHGLLTLRIIVLATVLPAIPLSAQDGKTLFTQHCAACHLPDRQLVGPSLVEVSKLYSAKIDEFLAWCKKPIQKRKGVIQMPPMGHVGDPNLKLIHAHILEASKGLKEIKVRGLDPFYASPSMRKRPQVQRLFMPEAGPAAIAVAVNDELHYCWDAGECRLRYIWKGDFIDGWAVWRGNGNGLAKIQGEVLLREEKNPVPYLDLVDSARPRPKFLGYSLVEGLPTFRWRAGKIEVTETIRPTSDGKALTRSFAVTGEIPSALKFKSSDKMSVSTESAVLDGNGRLTVTLTPKP
ncbi:MAG: c-type cytochrome [Roseibacillus sp.]|nr:c-type cytochrome [Roseibacillus sp.]